MHVAVLQRLVLKRRAGKVRGDFRLPGDKRRAGVRVRQAHADLIKAFIVAVAIKPGGFDLQRAGLKAHARRRYGDAVFIS